MTTDPLQFTIFNTLRISLQYLMRHIRDFMALMALPVIIPTLLITASLTARAYGLEQGSTFLYYLFLFANFVTYVMFCVAVHHHVSFQKRGSISTLLAWDRYKTSYLLALGIYLLLNMAVLLFGMPFLKLPNTAAALLSIVLILLVVNVLFSLILPASAISETAQIAKPLQLGKAFFGKILGVHIAFTGLFMGLAVLFMSVLTGGVEMFVDIPKPDITAIGNAMGNTMPVDPNASHSILHTLSQIHRLGEITVADGGLAGFPYLFISLIQSVFSHTLLAFYLIMLSMFYIRATDSYNETE